MDKDKVLDAIFADDPLGLLEVKPKTSYAKSTDQRLAESFEDINQFFEQNGREPEPNAGSVSEFKLYSRLKALREDPNKIVALKDIDVHDLLPEIDMVAEDGVPYIVEKKEIRSIDDILDDDGLDILGGDDAGLYDFKHTPKETTMPEYVASRKKCEDFEEFEHLLRQCQVDLRDGKRRLLPFRNEQQIEKGYFFVLKGILLYVAEVGERVADANGKVNTRLRCIFENGTESDMLLRSLAAELYKDGRRVTEHDDRLLDNFKGVDTNDESVGYIYVLKSKSKEERIANIEDLYKIGYSRVSVETRIRNAEKQPTYLMAPVEYIAGWQCFNMNPQKFEQLIHNFFGASCLNVDVYDDQGKRHTPQEWFIAPLDVIEDAVALIISGEVVNYKYDAGSRAIAKR